MPWSRHFLPAINKSEWLLVRTEGGEWRGERFITFNKQTSLAWPMIIFLPLMQTGDYDKQWKFKPSALIIPASLTAAPAMPIYPSFTWQCQFASQYCFLSWPHHTLHLSCVNISARTQSNIRYCVRRGKPKEAQFPLLGFVFIIQIIRLIRKIFITGEAKENT